MRILMVPLQGLISPPPPPTRWFTWSSDENVHGHHKISPGSPPRTNIPYPPPWDGSHGLMVRIIMVTMRFLLVPFQGLTSNTPPTRWFSWSHGENSRGHHEISSSAPPSTNIPYTPPWDGSCGLMVRIFMVTMRFILVPFQGLTSPTPPHKKVLVVSWWEFS